MKTFSDKIQEKEVPFARNNRIKCDLFAIIDENLSVKNNFFLKGQEELVFKLEKLIEKELMLEELKTLESYKKDINFN